MLSAPTDQTTLSTHQIHSVNQLIRQHDDLVPVFQPLNQLYYDGPMGGYGEHLKARSLGFAPSGYEGVRRTLELREMQVPILSSPAAFRQFIADTPILTRAVALLMHDAVFTPLGRSSPQKMYAILYEKRQSVDTLFTYDSTRDMMELDAFKPYFRADFRLLQPDAMRSYVSDTDALYAIQDAKRLMHYLDSSLSDDNYPSDVRDFHVHDALLYHEESLIKEHVETMLDALNHLNLSNQAPMCRIS